MVLESDSLQICLTSSNALKVNPLTGAWNGGDMKTNKFRVRYVFAF